MIRAGFPELEQLAEHGLMKPPAMQGLTDEQIEELKLVDEFASKVRWAFVFVNLRLGWARRGVEKGRRRSLFSTPNRRTLFCSATRAAARGKTRIPSAAAPAGVRGARGSLASFLTLPAAGSAHGGACGGAP